jgi:hypothetical protein
MVYLVYMKILIKAEEMMDMVRVRLLQNGYRFDNMKHEIKTGNPDDKPEYEGISFEMEPTALMKKVL